MYNHLALSENGFLFDTRTGTTYSLNRSGAWLLRALIKDVPKSELSQRLTEAFDVDEVTARRDVEQFLFRIRELALAGGQAGESAQ